MRKLRILASFLGAALSALVLIWPPAASAETFMEIVEPFAQTSPNPCNGDVVMITGRMKIVMITNRNSGKVQSNWPDTVGVALDGTRYQANDTQHVTVFPIAEDGSFSIRFAEEFELVSLDKSPNFLIHMAVEIKFDPSMPPVVTMTHGGAECSGPTPAPF